MKEVKMGIGRKGVRFLEDGRESRLPGLLYADDLFCGMRWRMTWGQWWDGLLRCVGEED